MKQFTKRTIAAFCVMVLLLAGCGSNAASTAETESAVMETAVAETETTAETEKSGTETAESASADDQIATAYSLGLRKIGDVTVQPNNAQTKGKVAKIIHLVEVIEA